MSFGGSELPLRCLAMHGRNGVLMNEVEEPVLKLEEQREQLDRVLRSNVFKSAHALRKFLEYVGSKALAGFSAEVKEYAIGTEVFGRPANYDPRIDTVVRVQAIRLREKLREYYEQEGAGDQVLLAVPKGHYVTTFSRRTAQQAPEPLRPSPLKSPSQSVQETDTSSIIGEVALKEIKRSRATLTMKLLVCGAVALLLVVTAFVWVRPQLAAKVPEGASAAGTNSSVAPSAASLEMWADFLRRDSSPMVAYSNDVFLRTGSSDLLRVKSQEVGNLGASADTDLASSVSNNPQLLLHAGPVSFDDTYTGTGEVMGVYYLMRMFGPQATLKVKRSRLVTTDDLSRHDFIFLGSTRANELLLGLPLRQDFVFNWPRSGGMWEGRITNLHPQNGEAKYYDIERDPKNHALRNDYALISFLPGLAPNRRIVVLAGLTTIGTQAATEFATSEEGMAELAKHLAIRSQSATNRLPPFFQALLRVDIVRSEILNVSYVTGHAIEPSQQVAQRR